jgi:hypothetical protein
MLNIDTAGNEHQGRTNYTGLAFDGCRDSVYVALVYN